MSIYQCITTGYVKMRFELYLTEDRSKSLKEEDFVKLIKSGVYDDAIKGFDKKQGILFRGVMGSKYTSYTIIDPTKGRLRRSANTSNEYTLLVDNLPEWKDYPKRGRSLICTTDEYYATGFGDVRIILPVNGAKLGVCKGGDFWDSFTLIFPELRATEMDSFNKRLQEIIGMDFDKNWPTLRKQINRFDKDELDFYVSGQWRSLIDKHGSLMKSLKYILDPKNNEFYLSQIGKSLMGLGEVWTDSPCISISVDESVSMSDDIIKKVGYIKEIRNI